MVVQERAESDVSVGGALGGASTGLPKGPRAPVLLQTLMAWGPWGDRNLERLGRRYGDAFTIRILPTGTMVMLSNPDAIKEVFTASPSLLHAGEGNDLLRPVLGDRSVLVLDEREHMHRRKLMLPLFHGEAVKQYAQIIGEVAAAEVDAWPLDERFALLPRMRALTFDVIARAVFGVEEEARLERFREAIPAMMEIGLIEMDAWMWPGLERYWPWSRYARVRARADALLMEEIAARRADPGLADRHDILSLLLAARDEDGNPMEDRDIRDQLVTMLLAGHETTATTLAWAVECLLRDPPVLARAQAAAREADDAYLDAVVNETLRMRPVITVIARRLTRDARIAGYDLPAGTVLSPAIGIVHHSASLYPEPLRFRPERFLDERAPSYAWIPFGGGTRRCLGAAFAQLELRLVLKEILARATLVPADRRPDQPRTRHITCVPSRGVRVRLRARARALPARTPSPPALPR